MRKLLSILALVLLATTALAMPEGWRGINGMVLNEGAEIQDDALITGGQVYLNIPNRSLDVIPAADGSGAVIHMTVPLPPGVSLIGSWVETANGWKRWMDNGWLYRLLDLQSMKVPQALSAYKANGAMFVFDKIPVSDVINDGDGYWRPKDLQFSVTNAQLSDFVATIQPPLTQDEVDRGNTRPAHIVGGIIVGHKEKRNNLGHRNYMTGDFLQIPAPLLVAWDENDQYVGHFFGTYENAGGGRFPKAYHIQDALAALGPAQDIAYLSISADIGYTVIGGSNQNVALVSLSGPFTVSENLTVESATHYCNGQYFDLFSQLYEGPGDTTDTPVANGFTVWDTTELAGWKTNAFSTPPTITPTGDVSIAFGTFGVSIDQQYNSAGGDWRYYQPTWASEAAVLDPIGTATGSSANFNPSQYITATAATTPPTVNTVVASPSEVTAGTNISLVAGITDDDHTISQAEYYLGADPGEGNGVAMSLGAGTTSRTATATIDTTLLLGPYTVRVRGKDETDGWGATNFDTFTVNAAPAGATGGAGISTSIGLEL